MWVKWDDIRKTFSLGLSTYYTPQNDSYCWIDFHVSYSTIFWIVSIALFCIIFYVFGFLKYNDFPLFRLNFDLFKSLEFTEDKELSSISWMVMFILDWLGARWQRAFKSRHKFFPLQEATGCSVPASCSHDYQWVLCV